MTSNTVIYVCLQMIPWYRRSSMKSVTGHNFSQIYLSPPNGQNGVICAIRKQIRITAIQKKKINLNCHTSFWWTFHGILQHERLVRNCDCSYIQQNWQAPQNNLLISENFVGWSVHVYNSIRGSVDAFIWFCMQVCIHVIMVRVTWASAPRHAWTNMLIDHGLINACS